MSDFQLPFNPVRRLCERPGCGGIAEVSYGIDKAHLTVWVDNIAVSERELAGRLCRRHANALTVPRGWTIDDRRQPIPRLFVIEDQPKPKRVRRPKNEIIEIIDKVVVAPLSLFEKLAEDLGVAAVISAPGVVVSGPIDPDETQAIPWSPRFVASTDDDDGDDDGPKPVLGRLMGRAFGQPESEE